MKELSYGDIVEAKNHYTGEYETGIITDRAPSSSRVCEYEFGITFKDGTFCSWYRPDVLDVISYSEFRVE